MTDENSSVARKMSEAKRVRVIARFFRAKDILEWISSACSRDETRETSRYSRQKCGKVTVIRYSKVRLRTLILRHTQALYYFSRGALLNLPERNGSSNPYNRRILPEPRSTHRREPVTISVSGTIQIFRNRIPLPDRVYIYLRSKCKAIEDIMKEHCRLQ